MTARPRALITGVTGQDGSYLTEFLLAKNYEVHGIVRRAGTPAPAGVETHFSDLSQMSTWVSLIKEIAPHEIYNLAGQSSVRASFDMPEHTGDVNALGAVRLLEAIRKYGTGIRFLQASSSEMYGKAVESPQTESTPLFPRSPYACAKAYAHAMVGTYRQAYGLHVSAAILFNHESPRRTEAYVTRKITRAVARIKAGKESKLALGNMEARRDWGYAKDYVEAMWLMLQQPTPGDYVIATGKTHTIREFVEEAFAVAELDWREHVVSDPKLLRPTEPDLVVGDPSLAAKVLGWKPKTDFKALVRMMVQADLALEGIS